MTAGGPFQPAWSCGSTTPKPRSKPSPEHGKVRGSKMTKCCLVLVQSNKSFLIEVTLHMDQVCRKICQGSAMRFRANAETRCAVPSWWGYCKVHVHLQEVSYLLWESSDGSEMVQKADQERELSFLLANSLSKTFRGALCLELLLWQLHWQKRSSTKYIQKACHRSLGRETAFSIVQLYCAWPKPHKWPGVLDKTVWPSPICPIHNKTSGLPLLL